MSTLFKVVGTGSFLVLLGEAALLMVPTYYIPFCGVT